MSITAQVPELIRQKLAAFESIQAEFEACFPFMQEVHGRKNFSPFPVEKIVYYLHALWLCECKDRLLSIFKNIRRYEGRYCLEMLKVWQAGQSTEVVAFLVRKLDLLSFTDITAQIEEARNQQQNEALAQRLEYGRRIMLNRGENLMHALEAIFSPSSDELLREVRQACEQYGHTPERIEAQLAEMEKPLYAYRPHQLLAQRNMLVMNKLTVDVFMQTMDGLGERDGSIFLANETLAPFAEQVILDYTPLLAPQYNNRQQVRFVDRIEPDRGMPL